jgi:hypothetical protein
MPRARTRRATRPLPPPLPPAERTVGQLVGEAIRAYGRLFFRALPLGLVVAVVDQLTIGLDNRTDKTGVLLAAGPAFALAYVYATRLVLGRAVPTPTWFVAFAIGIAVWIPAALLFFWFALAAVLWLAAFGLAVPVAMAENRSALDSLRRGFALARADYVHAAGTLATLIILFVVTRGGLALVLEAQADNTLRVAIFLADAVLAPLLFLGSALLYGDQEARLRSPAKRRKERHAEVPDALHADREGRADAARESRPSA